MSTGLRFTLEVDGLPPDAFAVVSFHLNQSLSSLFSLDLSLVSQQFLSLAFAQVLDKMAYLTIWQGDEVQRRVKGVVTWFELGENDKNQMLYSMKVHPPLWRAGLRQNFRIFQNEDIKSILGTMLQENGVTEWSPLFSEPHPSREFCVQYGETDYDFLCRMAAEEGIFFYEEHAYKSTDQSLVLCDTVRHLPESFEIPWNPNTRTEVSTLCISQFRYSAQTLTPEDERDRHPDESLLKTTYRYNAAGELTEVILPGDETLTFSRDEAGREVFRHSNRGFACEQGWNAASQLVTQRAGFFPEETTWGGLLPSLVREYRYDSAGNVSAVTSREDYGRETRREYRLDRNGQVTAVTASGTGLGYGEGDESYGYDSCGYLKAQSAGRHRISEETDQYAGGHRLKQAGNTQYDYDAAGRMVSRTRHRDGYRPETERFRWDSRDQLTGYCSAQGELWEYRHDASGRRTEKRCDRKKIRFTYLWDGDSIAEIREYRDDKLYSVRHLVFNGFELISQQFSRVRQPHPSVAPLWVTRTNHAVSDLTGRPLMLFNSEGKTVWRPGQTSLWGLALSLPADTGYPDPRGELDPEADPGLLYAGQWQDAESGLCYNRFRYYEPESGMYLVSDPLGLQGGEQTYRYVPNPCGYVDPLGLVGCSTKLGKNMMEAMGLARSTTWKGYRAHHIIPKELWNHPVLQKIKYDIDKATNGIFLRKVDDGVSAMARHQGNHDGYTQVIKDALDKIDINQSTDVITKQIEEIQKIARNGLENGYPVRPLDMDSIGGAAGNSKVYSIWTKIFDKGGW
ncbi:type VI secretion system tip protein VgrG [Escherichia coli]|nr:type VI secretion system tip protein VgrG [Escherichia coli]EFC6593627.1 type VI secretion system tip protein VgrG [Escherichia coli]EFN5255607.1 type VI secretion system tip protein VgrG [Escherichia coli]EFN5667498.1 type VI secretion system tip protein VgrG [Escherichia coli]EGQ2026237.1 type VI secretion system tip protein VgrG [Escherichia coli]